MLRGMTEVRIRGVPDHVVEALERGAAARHMSLQRYLRDLLETEADFVISAEERKEWFEEWMEPFDCHTGQPVTRASAAHDAGFAGERDNVVVLTRRGRGRRS
jgi:hypothetical protein